MNKEKQLGVVIILFAILVTMAKLSQQEAKPDKIQELNLANNINAFYIKDDSLPIFTLNLAFKNAGYAYDANNKQGIAQLVSGTINEGAGELNWLEFTEELKDNAISIDYSAGKDNFFISIKCNTQDIEKALYLLELSITNPTFGPEEVKKVKNQFYSIISQKEASIKSRASNYWKEQYYKDHAYSNKDFGTKKTINNISNLDLKNYVIDNFTKDNVVFAAAGNFNKKLLTKKLNKLIDKLPKRAKTNSLPKHSKSPSGTKLDYYDKPQSIIYFGGKTVPRKHKDFYPIYVANHILGGSSFESRLYKKIRKELGLAYSIGSWIDYSSYANVIQGSTATDSAKVSSTLKEIKQCLANFYSNGITQDELNNAKAYLIGSFNIRLDTNSKISSFLLGMQLYNLDKNFITNRKSIIEEITLEQVNSAIKQYLNPNSYLYTVTGKT